ncbi:Nucleotide-binding universal stress protein, UspA family [Paracoccus alcaliphilus]|uniref:Nucleotide-binding universal stress protein, UspA family n=1 Tax=Paracoccus alcaliphilus TaxID=34002 RepID=A0A1H8LJF8_9RHOB|nr:universal stress protein [Paracoccus alcaliphilus]WCR19744.1 universal stress protein [Paracoccus alcaliphilus]SEO05300.1 Nucleotide-binding universal stress protein, UspA family [Paracoccus alcaliphilus]
MAYKTILTIVTDTRELQQLDAAADMAIREDGHLEVLCLGINPIEAGYFFPGGAPYAFQETIAQAMEDARTLETAVRERLGSSTELRWSIDSAAVQSGGLSSLIGLRARFSDLTVLPRPYGTDAGVAAEAVTEAALFEGGCPVLVLADGTLPAHPPRRVLVAWNQSLEALAAVRRALPMLKAAGAVEITVIDPRRAGAERSDPGGALAQMLIRHGVKAEIAVLARTEPTISEELNRRATEIGADLIVMGAYGHSRFREAILGGATRNMLEKARVPVLMAR